jgi:hypothetical protein
MAKTVKRVGSKAARRKTAKKPVAAKAAGRAPRAAATARAKVAASKVAASMDALGVTPEFTAAAAGCLDQAVATRLVFSCTGVGAVPPGTRLGQLFASPVQRQGFCGCVFNKARMAGSAITPGEVPCQPSTTIGDVIDSLAC